MVRLDRLMAAAAALGAVANLALLAEPGAGGAIAARIVTGLALAGVYPPALKLMATWFRRGRGLALGLLIGALTLGSALPHLFRAARRRSTGGWSSASAPPRASPPPRSSSPRSARAPIRSRRATMDPRQIGAVFRNRPLMLANLGYFGHMWELYAMWGWFLAFAAAAAEAGGGLIAERASLVTFAVVAAGLPGCILGGLLSDRFGRTLTTAGLMAASGALRAARRLRLRRPGLGVPARRAGLGRDHRRRLGAVLRRGHRARRPALRRHRAGAAARHRLRPDRRRRSGWCRSFAAWIGGWRWAFLLLVPGPVVGAAAMLALRRRPEAVALAGGLR